MELLRPGDEFLAAFNPPPSHGADMVSLPNLDSNYPSNNSPKVVPEYFVFNFPACSAPSEAQYLPPPNCYNYPTTPCTPITPSADVPESPFDVFTNYQQFKFEELAEIGPLDQPIQQPHTHTGQQQQQPLQQPPQHHPQQHSPATPGYQLDSDQYTGPPAPPPPFPFPPVQQIPLYSSCGEPTSSMFTGDLSRQPFPDPGSFFLPPGQQAVPGDYPGHTYPTPRDQGNRFLLDNTLILQAEEAYNRGNHENVLQILASHFFDKSHHEQLQHLWLAAVYARESALKKKTLTAVDRYRLRKRNPFPPSIWEGEKTIYCLKKSARDSLTNFFERNPYPTPTEKRRLASSCELSYVQISNWFKNKRMREKESNRLK